MSFRIGQGFDVHRLVENRKCILCGVEIPHNKGLLGHSDADAAVHALMDAILGAAAAGDIGQLFPDKDPAWKGADSMELLAKVLAHPLVAPYRVVNADITIIAQEPKIAPFRDAMQKRLAEVMPCDAVSVKATTTEKLGFTGRGEGIAASAVVLLEKR
jgi:2-C-methyl-D-erythritol 2,4-cyclodiphosphate synthase